MNLSRIFIERPIMTTLVTFAILLFGIVAWKMATEALYLRVLGRRPSVDELNVYARYLTSLGKGKRREAYEDLLWALINSTEFLCRR